MSYVIQNDRRVKAKYSEYIVMCHAHAHTQRETERQR